ncbi:hypothetical protein PG994_009579 [Apiospora phragmitis]|uniref:Uncharacterized protein n=1 Tax=Apiospora phragmitis TaxID=2905665 RepID=A0ABR1U6K9_9PEZI
MADRQSNPPTDSGPRNGDPAFVLHSPAVDFIENRGSEYHPALDATMCRYSPKQGKFMPLVSSSAAMHIPGSSNITIPIPAGPVSPQPRPTPGSVGEMGFWAEVFPEAMKRLIQEALSYSGPYRQQWGIWHLGVWPDVPAKLDMARRDYEQFNGQQSIGKFRRRLRHSLDKAAVPLQQGLKLVPDIEIASPVVGAIELLVDAYRQAATVRETVHSGFDDLPETFVRIEFYMKSYPKDENILAVSIDLVLAIFKAIEEAIGFYTSAQAKHAGLAILTGEEYQQKLLRSLKEISVCSGRLESRASMSFTHRVISGVWPSTSVQHSYQIATTANYQLHSRERHSWQQIVPCIGVNYPSFQMTMLLASHMLRSCKTTGQPIKFSAQSYMGSEKETGRASG